MRGLFAQEPVATSANPFLDGLLSDDRRKTGWMRAKAAGNPGSWRNRLSSAKGDGTRMLRDIVRDYVIVSLATDEAVMVIDETVFPKQGKAYCGVARQYTGSAGKTKTARPVFSLPMYLLAVTLLYIVPSICRRAGLVIPCDLSRPMFLSL